MTKEKDIKDFASRGDFIKTVNETLEYMPFTNMMSEITERSAMYLEFMAAAFIQETGIKASECKLLCWYNPTDSSIHWEFRKKNRWLKQQSK